MSYILIPAFQQLWFQWGKPAWVLGSARKMNLHSSLNYITTEQLKIDVTWLFNALSQALGTGRGGDIIITYMRTQDGIAAYHQMMTRYLYGGDVETFKKEQMDILTTNFSRGYPGGALAYLDNWEQAAVRLSQASPEEAMTDKQKRTAFSIRFSVLGLTDTLVDTVMYETLNCHQFTDTL